MCWKGQCGRSWESGFGCVKSPSRSTQWNFSRHNLTLGLKQISNSFLVVIYQIIYHLQPLPLFWWSRWQNTSHFHPDSGQKSSNIQRAARNLCVGGLVHTRFSAKVVCHNIWTLWLQNGSSDNHLWHTMITWWLSNGITKKHAETNIKNNKSHCLRCNQGFWNVKSSINKWIRWQAARDWLKSVVVSWFSTASTCQRRH